MRTSFREVSSPLDDKITTAELCKVYHAVKHHQSYRSVDCGVKVDRENVTAPYSALTSYFQSEGVGECARIVQRCFGDETNEVSESYFLFLSHVLKVFSDTIEALEAKSFSITSVLKVMTELKQKLERRMKDRYNIVIFGAIDGFSRKIFYLDTAGNNKAETALDSSWMEFGKMDGHQEYEPIKGLKILEEEGFIDLSIAVHLFCVGSSKLRSNPLRNSKVTTLVPDIQCPLSAERLAALQHQVNPTTESSSFGRDIYLQALRTAFGL
ncbi:unnamed protein product [Arctogadus glacialis]